MRIYFVFAVFLLMLLISSSCGSIVPQQPQITTETPMAIPEVNGTVKIPFEVNLKPYFDLADKSIPKTFRGKEEQCDGVSFSILFHTKTNKFQRLQKYFIL